ncbi:hypothetical protein HNR11_001386 [Nesterenkonia sandarakina]|uniref:Uncharacterized protein n=1 Tax=Nesterenkonia sandarakina TaxID=272918 RepID=A0A7Z0J317_9MICC|nr:hypothetical protein [Nesterenkonia sandarakina]
MAHGIPSQLHRQMIDYSVSNRSTQKPEHRSPIAFIQIKG